MDENKSNYRPKNNSIIGLIRNKAKQFILSFFNGKLGGHGGGMFGALLLITLYPVLMQPFTNSLGLRLNCIICMVAYFVAYSYTYIGSLIKSKIVRNIYFTVVFILVSVHCVMNTACFLTVHSALDADIVTAILTTNENEASEFCNSYFTPKVIIAILTLAILIFCLLIFIKWIRFKTSTILGRIGTIVYLICAVITATNLKICHFTSVGLVKDVIFFTSIPKLKVYQNTPKLSIRSENQPPLIVWVIGESLTNHHCSLYGYDKPTNPFTKERVDNGEVLLFKNVQAAGTHTQDCFQKMMSTYDSSMGDEIKWNEYYTLPDIAKTANFHTCWLSNQSKKGLFDNIVSQYAEFCDTTTFIGNMFAGIQRVNYDGELLPVFDSMLQNCRTAHDFFILHLMGCHENFKKRYPSSFNFFKESDYSGYPQKQRAERAAYDNSIRYNDYVVNSVFDLVSQHDAIVIYAPDHGIDVFESNPNVANHSNNMDPISVKAALDIPFLIYMTHLFRERHSDFAQRALQSVNRSFNLEDVIYLMMDIMQCDFENSIVAQKSLVRRE